MKTLRLVSEDQLSHDIPALEGLNTVSGLVFMIEVAEERICVPHFVQKTVLVASGMGHFAVEM
jgi:deoxyribodipyrimidine photolyase-like uncharacterized protein